MTTFSFVLSSRAWPGGGSLAGRLLQSWSRRSGLVVLACLVWTLGMWSGLAHAQLKNAQPVAADPVLEKRVLALSEQLRCLVCQNQTIADSHADLAIDLRNQVREKMAQGWSDAQVIDFMVARYGDFVLYKPPVKSITWLLWFGPFILFAGGLGFLLFKLKRQPAGAEPAPADLQRAAALLQNAESPEQNKDLA